MSAVPSAWRLAAVALGITAGQLLFVLVSGWQAPGRPPKAADDSLFGVYPALHQWDSGWYANIAENGYRAPDPRVPGDVGTVVFFPGYPLAGRGLHAVTGWRVEVALLVVSQLACWAMWAYLLLLLRDMGASARGAAIVVGVLLCHPAAYFLVSAYSESLFLAGFLGMCFWAARPGWPALALAGAHGAVMTATRIVGVPLVVIPLVAVFFAAGSRWRDLARPAAVAAMASLGCLSFFAWCHVRFGRWDMYMATEQAGWGVRPNYFFPLDHRVYKPSFTVFWRARGNPALLDAALAAYALLTLMGAAAAEAIRRRFGDRGLRRRLAWYAAAAALVYVPLAGHYHRQYGSFTRFSLVAAVPFLLLCADAFKGWAWRWRWTLAVPLAAAALAGLAIQANNIQFFVLGKWTY